MNINKNKAYNVVFTHSLDKEDTIHHTLSGGNFYRVRNMYSDLGYVVDEVVEAVIH